MIPATTWESSPRPRVVPEINEVWKDCTPRKRRLVSFSSGAACPSLSEHVPSDTGEHQRDDD
jgi:hypothetical protein